MFCDKKSLEAGRIRDKFKYLINAKEQLLETQRNPMSGYSSGPGPYVDLYERRALAKYEDRKYFTIKEKNFIIDYLIDCMVENEAFDLSTLGPNLYLNNIKNEHSAIVSNT